MGKKYVCISGTYYNILLFCLVVDFLDKTIFFVDPRLQLERKKDFHFYADSKGKFHKKLDLYRNYWKFYNLKKKYGIDLKSTKIQFFVQDHILSSYLFLHGKKFSVLEDGTMNYWETEKQYQRKKRLSWWTCRRRALFGKIWSLGISEQAEKVFLRGILPIPKCIQNKVELIDIYQLWDQKTEEEKTWLNSLFRMKEEDLLRLQRKKIILFTQPLSEDDIISEAEKVEIYKNILKEYAESEVLIKVHPRETTDYLFHFPEVAILRGITPIELYVLNGLKIETAITLFSTAIYGLKEQGVNVIFHGTGIHENIRKCVGDENFETNF